MDTPSCAVEEVERLAALASFGVLDTPAEREFDDLTRLAAVALGVASAAVSLIDERRQWFKARHGIPFDQTPRDIAFCTHAVASRALLVVPDASLDPRFQSNPLVTQDAGIRFYAGAPLIVASGHCLGTLCVFDPTPRTGLTQEQHAVLTDLAKLAADLIESRRSRRMGEIAAKVVDATSDAVIAANRDGLIVYWNPAAERMFGRSRQQALGRSVEHIVPARLAAVYRDAFRHAARGEPGPLSGPVVEFIGARADGGEFPIELSLAPWGAPESDHGFAAIVRDISERKALEREREHAQTFLGSVITNLPAMLFVKDVETRAYLVVNRAGEQAIGRPADQMVGHTDKELFPDYGEGYEQRDSDAIASGGQHVFESQFTRDDGETIHLRTIRTLIDGPDRPGQYLLGISEDVTQTRTAQAEVRRLAHYDPLTGLLNRVSYTERLHRLVKGAQPFAMLSIDLDRFKAINDQFGHPAGDKVLVQVAERLRVVGGDCAWIARIGGDEFMAILEGDDLRERAGLLAQAILASLAQPFAIERRVAHAGASIGIVLSPVDGASAEQLRENVDLALYRAKHGGRGGACFFNADMDAAARDRRRIELDLRQAIAAGEVTLAYQPLISARTGEITSVEALARWNHAERGPIRPDVFIALAEEGGLIDDLGERLLRKACLDAQTWPEHVSVAVNLSPLQFVSDNLLSVVQSALSMSGLTPRRLQLEVTEGLVIRDVERTFRQLEELRRLGIQILIDDFGVGYSSLSYFQRFPFDKVKIDKSFVDDVATSRAAKAIIQAVVGLGEQLGMAVVAEGVETEEQMRMLVALGCTHLQGYFISRPLALHALQSMLQNTLDTARLVGPQAA